jgi:hypothetical protein
MTRIACIIIATERRKAQLDRVVDSACGQGFDEIVVVGDWDYDGAWWRFLNVAPLTRSTTDALIKRDVGTLAVKAEVLVYLCDDHTLGLHFGAALRDVLHEPWDVIVPNRYTYNNGDLIPLNGGERDGYCPGHAGVFRRHVVTAKPWSAHAHHRNWDVLISVEQQQRGARFVWKPRDELCIRDIEPENHPWL